MEQIDPIEKASLESIMRSFLIKLSTADTYFKPLPQGKKEADMTCLPSFIEITFYVIIETEDELNPLSREMMQNDLKTVKHYYNHPI